MNIKYYIITVSSERQLTVPLLHYSQMPQHRHGSRLLCPNAKQHLKLVDVDGRNIKILALLWNAISSFIVIVFTAHFSHINVALFSKCPDSTFWMNCVFHTTFQPFFIQNRCHWDKVFITLQKCNIKLQIFSSNKKYVLYVCYLSTHSMGYNFFYPMLFWLMVFVTCLWINELFVIQCCCSSFILISKNHFFFTKLSK